MKENDEIIKPHVTEPDDEPKYDPDDWCMFCGEHVDFCECEDCH